MIAEQRSLNTAHINSFNRFLLDSTYKVLPSIEAMLGVSIDSSNSSIDVSRAGDNENLKHVGSGSLYTVSSEIQGDLQGQMLLLMRSTDFRHLGEVMRPLLSLMFLSNLDTDLEVLDKRKPGWMLDDDDGSKGRAIYHDQMLDTLGEIGNLLIGVYSRGIYRISKVNSHHTAPLVVRDPDQKAIRNLQSSPGTAELFHLVIENEFVMENKPVKLWCLISLTTGSFQHILDMIDLHCHGAVERT